MAKYNASEPLAHPTQNFVFVNFEKFFQKFLTSSPKMKLFFLIIFLNY